MNHASVRRDKRASGRTGRRPKPGIRPQPGIRPAEREGFMPSRKAFAALSRRAAMAGLLAFAMAPAAWARPEEPAVSARGFLEGIYRTYVAGAAPKGIALDQPDAVRRYFSPGLASLILEDSVEAARRGEVPTLAGDPFVGHQEWQIADLAIDVKDAAVKAVGTVSFTNFGKPEKLLLELLKVGEAWRIADIRWPSGTLRDRLRRK
jgi:hypothetical protein